MTNTLTRKELYTALVNAFANGSLELENIDSARAVEILNKDIANANKSRISKKEQEKRTEIDDAIYEIVATTENPITATEIVAELENELSVQAVVASLKRLMTADKVTKVKDGKKTFFHLTSIDVENDDIE